jgi:hypothetical protein
VGLRYLLIILHIRMGNLGICLSYVGMNMLYLVSRDRLRTGWLDTPAINALVSHIHTNPRTKLSVFSVLMFCRYLQLFLWGWRSLYQKLMIKFITLRTSEWCGAQVQNMLVFCPVSGNAGWRAMWPRPAPTGPTTGDQETRTPRGKTSTWSSCPASSYWLRW